MTAEKELEIWVKVNKCTTLNELAKIIEDISFDGLIQGRTRTFSAKWMAMCCRNFNISYPTNLTREYGIRQQAIMIMLKYKK